MAAGKLILDTFINVQIDDVIGMNHRPWLKQLNLQMAFFLKEWKKFSSKLSEHRFDWFSEIKDLEANFIIV